MGRTTFADDMGRRYLTPSVSAVHRCMAVTDRELDSALASGLHSPYMHNKRRRVVLPAVYGEGARRDEDRIYHMDGKLAARVFNLLQRVLSMATDRRMNLESLNH